MRISNRSNRLNLEMIDFCNHLIQNYESFLGIDLGIYGDLHPRLDKLLDKLKEG